MKDNVYENFMIDLCLLLKDMAIQSKEDSNDDFSRGVNVGLVSVLSLIQQQAETFQIPLNEIHLNDIDPEQDFL